MRGNIFSKPKQTSIIWISGMIFIAILLLIFLFPANNALPDEIDYNYHIKPILSQNCYTCHGPDSSSREADLRLDIFEGATALTESGHPAINPGDADNSMLIKRVLSADPTKKMPPPESNLKLTEEQIALLEAWIEQGAQWKKHWSFIPPDSNILKKHQNKSAHEIIDQLLDEEIAYHSLETSHEANKNQLIRRLSYQIKGLPPKAQETVQFVEDSSPEAYTRLLDQYLYSPAFGERWARHWMDVVRYAESRGHEFDYNIDGAWRYRDYLIRAFNEDLPYDQFVLEHLAGDQLASPRVHPQRKYNESVIGTAFYSLGEGKHSPVDVKQEEADVFDNMIDVTSKAFQGLTVGCARCHDHKFDPIPTTDYYSLYGILESSRNSPVPVYVQPEKAKAIQSFISRQQKLRKTLAADWQVDWVHKASDSFLPESEVKQNTDTSFQMMADFTQSNWGGWESFGKAFGDKPAHGHPILDAENEKIIDLAPPVVTSRKIATGIFGALRSPNFTVTHDYLTVMAAGEASSIRLIADNFQLIQYPIYGGLSRELNDPDMRLYTLDLRMVKGKNAYIEIIPGTFMHYKRPAKKPRHVYHLKADAWIEAKYILAHNAPQPPSPKLIEPLLTSARKVTSLSEAVIKWEKGEADGAEVNLIRKAIRQGKLNRKNRGLSVFSTHELGQQIAAMPDSSYIVGLTKGKLINSPVFIRGSIKTLGEEVPHTFFAALRDQLPTSAAPENYNRLSLAKSVIHPENPLTARVIVNRVWQHMFGKGIVKTVDNFGVQGALPTHPELLDYLALAFVKNGWSIKWLIREIALTRAFRRSVEATEQQRQKDPTNKYLARYPIRRLEAEAIRDGLLAVSGKLDTTMYGESVPVHLTSFMTGRGRPGKSGPLDGEGRRSIYVAVRRNFLSPMMLVFDMPVPFTTFGNRNVSNVPAQSLTMLNDPFVIQQAESWAYELLAKYQSDEERIKHMYLTAFSRLPDEVEIKNAQTFIKEQTLSYGCDPEILSETFQAWADFSHTLFNMKEFIFLQ